MTSQRLNIPRTDRSCQPLTALRIRVRLRTCADQIDRARAGIHLSRSCEAARSESMAYCSRCENSNHTKNARVNREVCKYSNEPHEYVVEIEKVLHSLKAVLTEAWRADMSWSN